MQLLRISLWSILLTIVSIPEVGWSHEDHRPPEKAVPAPSVHVDTNHEHHTEEAESGFWLGKLHPSSVHFPIALLLAALAAELLWMRSGSELFAHAGRFCVWLGAAGALLAGALGWLFGGFQLTDDEWLLTAHRWFGTGTAALALATLALSEQACRTPSLRGRYRLVLVLTAIVVSVTGFLGGSLIYGIDHFAWSSE